MTLAEKVKMFCGMIDTPGKQLNKHRFQEVVSGIIADIEDGTHVDPDVFAEMSAEHRSLCLNSFVSLTAAALDA